MSYKLTKKAEVDLATLIDFSLERFGSDTALRHLDKLERSIEALDRGDFEGPEFTIASCARPVRRWLRTRKPSSPSDAVRAARAVVWEPAVTEHLNRIDALSRDISSYEANGDYGWKASAAGQTYFADRAGRRALAVQEAGREFKRLLVEFVKRLERIAA